MNRTDCDEHYNVGILENCSAADLEKKEHIYIHKFSTLYPLYLNKVNPFDLSLLVSKCITIHGDILVHSFILLLF